MAVSLSAGISAVLLLAFGALLLSAFGAVAAGSVRDASASGTVIAVVRALRDPLGDAFALAIALLGISLLVGSVGACLSAWLLRGFGAARAWAITGVGWLISGAADAVLATSVTGMLAAPITTVLPLLPEAAAVRDHVLLLTTVLFVAAVRMAVVVGLASGSWLLAAHLLRPHSAVARAP